MSAPVIWLLVLLLLGSCASDASSNPRPYPRYVCSLVVSFFDRVESSFDEIQPRFDASSSEQERVELMLRDALELQDAAAEFAVELEEFEGAAPFGTSAQIRWRLLLARHGLAQAEDVLRDPGISARIRTGRGGQLVGDAVGAMLGIAQVLNTPSLLRSEGADTCPPQRSMARQ